MKINLKKKEPELQKASADTEKLMKHLTVEKADAEKTQTVVAKDEVEATKGALEAQKIADEAESAVADANIKLAETLAEVSKLKKEHLTEIKSLLKPPGACRVVLAGVVILNNDFVKAKGEIVITTNE